MNQPIRAVAPATALLDSGNVCAATVHPHLLTVRDISMMVVKNRRVRYRFPEMPPADADYCLSTIPNFGIGVASPSFSVGWS